MSRRSPAASSPASRCIDLDYLEDSSAGTDANFVMTGTGGIVEIQGTAEGEPFSEEQFAALMGSGQERHSRTGQPAEAGDRELNHGTDAVRRHPGNGALRHDLDAAETFYADVLGLEKIGRADGRHVFFRCGPGVLLIFNAEATKVPPAPDASCRCRRTARSATGHLCFAASADEIDALERPA